MLAERLRLEAVGLTAMDPELKISHIKDGISWMDKNLKARRAALETTSLKPMKEAQRLAIEARAKSLDCARFIHERRILASWALTHNFVQRNKTFMKLAGAGDPTGNGCGFSFLRVVRFFPPSFPSFCCCGGGGVGGGGGGDSRGGGCVVP